MIDYRSVGTPPRRQRLIASAGLDADPVVWAYKKDKEKALKDRCQTDSRPAPAFDDRLPSSVDEGVVALPRIDPSSVRQLLRQLVHELSHLVRQCCRLGIRLRSRPSNSTAHR
jgi:hypothetical protein